MDILPIHQHIATAHIIFNGAYGEVTRQARQKNVPRQRMYRQAPFACMAQAEGVSLPVSRRLLAVLLGAQTPSVAQLGRWTRRAGQHAGRLLAVLDEHSRPRVCQVADEIYVSQRPILMVVEPQSLCWQTGRLAEHRDGTTWTEDLRSLPAVRSCPDK